MYTIYTTNRINQGRCFGIQSEREVEISNEVFLLARRVLSYLPPNFSNGPFRDILRDTNRLLTKLPDLDRDSLQALYQVLMMLFERVNGENRLTFLTKYFSAPRAERIFNEELEEAKYAMNQVFNEITRREDEINNQLQTRIKELLDEVGFNYFDSSSDDEPI